MTNLQKIRVNIFLTKSNNLLDLIAPYGIPPHKLVIVVGGAGHHFHIVQVPYNLSLQEAAKMSTQIVKGKRMSLLSAAQQLGISVVASATLMQVRLFYNLTASIDSVIVLNMVISGSTIFNLYEFPAVSCTT